MLLSGWVLRKLLTHGHVAFLSLVSLSDVFDNRYLKEVLTSLFIAMITAMVSEHRWSYVSGVCLKREMFVCVTDQEGLTDLFCDFSSFPLKSLHNNEHRISLQSCHYRVCWALVHKDGW